MLYKQSIFLLSVVLILALGHVAFAEDKNEAMSQKPLLYGIHAGQDSHFWQTVEAGALKAAEELGYSILYRGGAQTDANLQREVFNIALESGAKGIFIAPNDASRSEDVMRAKEKNIPVVYFDRTMGDNPAIASFIGTDNYNGGKLAAQELIKKLGAENKAKVVVFRMDKNVVPTTDREQGFIDTVTKAGYDVIASPYVSSEIGNARSLIQKFLLDPNTPSFDVIFTPSEYCAVATILTLQMMNKTKDYIHIGFDSGATIEKAIRDGDMYGTVVQQPFEMGYYSVKALDDVLHQRKVKPFIESKVIFVSKENLNTFEHTSRKE